MAAVQVFASSHWSQVPNAMAEHCAQVPPGPSKKKPVWQVAAVQRLSSLQAVQVPPSTTMFEQVGEVVGADDVDWSSAHATPRRGVRALEAAMGQAAAAIPLRCLDRARDALAQLLLPLLGYGDEPLTRRVLHLLGAHFEASKEVLLRAPLLRMLTRPADVELSRRTRRPSRSRRRGDAAGVPAAAAAAAG